MAITYYQANPELSPDPKVNLSIQVYDRTYFLRLPNACHLFMSQHIDVATSSDTFSLQNQAQILLSIFITGQTTDTLEYVQLPARFPLINIHRHYHNITGKKANHYIWGLAHFDLGISFCFSW
jgi:hypothetical protein